MNQVLKEHNDKFTENLEILKEMDKLIYTKNEAVELANSQRNEISHLSSIITIYEAKLLQETNLTSQLKKDLELMTKNKEQKERHMAVLVKEKEKVLRQMDQLTKNTNLSTKPVANVSRPQTAVMNAFKENASIMSNATTSIMQETLDINPDLLRKEISMLKKELKRIYDIADEKDREVEKLKKENYNLINRYRNK